MKKNNCMRALIIDGLALFFFFGLAFLWGRKEIDQDNELN